MPMSANDPKKCINAYLQRAALIDGALNGASDIGNLALFNGSLKIRQSSVAVSAIPSALLSDAFGQFRHQAKIGRHRLEFA
jgi:hypothetical protein